MKNNKIKFLNEDAYLLPGGVKFMRTLVSCMLLSLLSNGIVRTMTSWARPGLSPQKQSEVMSCCNTRKKHHQMSLSLLCHSKITLFHFKNKLKFLTILECHWTQVLVLSATWVWIPAWPVAALVSLSETLNHNYFVLGMGRNAVGPVCCAMHVKEPRTLIMK